MVFLLFPKEKRPRVIPTSTKWPRSIHVNRVANPLCARSLPQSNPAVLHPIVAIHQPTPSTQRGHPPLAIEFSEGERAHVDRLAQQASEVILPLDLHHHAKAVAQLDIDPLGKPTPIAVPSVTFRCDPIDPCCLPVSI